MRELGTITMSSEVRDTRVERLPGCRPNKAICHGCRPNASHTLTDNLARERSLASCVLVRRDHSGCSPDASTCRRPLSSSSRSYSSTFLKETRDFSRATPARLLRTCLCRRQFSWDLLFASLYFSRPPPIYFFRHLFPCESTSIRLRRIFFFHEVGNSIIDGELFRDNYFFASLYQNY